MERAEKWYEHEPEGIVETEEVKVLWDFMIQCDHVIECRKPDIVVVDKCEKRCLIIDIAIPGDNRVGKKEEEKIEKYQQLRHEIAILWGMKKVDVIPVVIGALGAVSMKLEKWMKKTEIEVKVELLQKTALLGTARIIRKVLNS